MSAFSYHIKGFGFSAKQALHNSDLLFISINREIKAPIDERENALDSVDFSSSKILVMGHIIH